MSSLTPHSALVHTMVMASAMDAEMTDSELLRIGQLIDRMPVFKDYEPDNLTTDAEACADLLASDGGVDAAIDQIKAALPARLRETAYAFACEIVAADGHASQEELQFLEVLSYDLEIDPLAAAAIQRGARARHARI